MSSSAVTGLAALWLALTWSPATALAQVQFGGDHLEKRHLPSQQHPTKAVVLGDLDGDGDLDMVVGNGRRNGAPDRLYFNDGSGRFREVTERLLAPVRYTLALALGDIDGDGDLDLFSGGSFGRPYSVGRNRLFLNDGSGSFANATPFRMPGLWTLTRALALGDVDGDGDLDLVLGIDGQDRLYRNDRGRFTDVTATQMPARWVTTTSVALGDVDGDGDVDMLLGGPGPNRLYFNEGSGSFADVSRTTLPPLQGSTEAVALGDVDGDGDLDLVEGNDGANRIYLNEGAGTFVDASGALLPRGLHITHDVALVDVDRDGHADLVEATAGANLLYLNDGAGRMRDVSATHMPPNWGSTQVVAVGDLDGDGSPDLTFGNGFTNAGEQNRLFLNDGSGAFRDGTAETLFRRNRTDALAVGDLDGDGDPDLITGNFRVRDRLFLNDGTGSLVEASAGRLPRDTQITRALLLADVDGDGDLDVLAGPLASRTRLYLNDGAAFFSDVTTANMPAQVAATGSLAAGDVDGDGDTDLLAGTSGQDLLLINDGDGVFAQAPPTSWLSPAQPTGAVFLLDVEGDGDLDILVGHLTSTVPSPNRLYLNDGQGVFTDVTSTALGAVRGVVKAVGDVDDDGDLDLVSNDVGARLALNDGAGVFVDVTSSRLPPAPPGAVALALFDAEGDDDLDLAMTGPAGLYLNNGLGEFEQTTGRVRPGVFASAMVTSDLDGDGDSDVILGLPLANRVHRNLHRQICAPFLASASRSFVLEFSIMPGYATMAHSAIPLIGFALSPLPLRLGRLGTLYLDPTQLVVLPAVAISQATGKGSVTLTIPAEASAVQRVLYAQALIANAVIARRMVLTGYTADPIH